VTRWFERYRERVSDAVADPDPRAVRVPFAAATPAQVRAALIPEEAREFDEQWRAVMAEATETLDLTSVLALLESWRRVAWITAESGHDAHRRMYRRAAQLLSGAAAPGDEPVLSTKARLGL
jgi:hypothetical protein